MEQLRKLAAAAATTGPVGVVSLLKKNALHHYRLWLDRRFDRRYGTDTSGRIELDRLSVLGENRAHGVYFESTPSALFAFFLGNVQIDFGRFTFVDLGSGKGRTLMLASDYPFRRILGVEFSRELHDAAVHNLSIYKNPRQRCHAIESVNADATMFDFPDTPLLIYAYNPFDDTVMTAVLSKLARSLQSHPRDVVLLYYNPRWMVMETFPQLSLRTRLAVPRDPTREVQRPAAVFGNCDLPRAAGWI